MCPFLASFLPHFLVDGCRRNKKIFGDHKFLLRFYEDRSLAPRRLPLLFSFPLNPRPMHAEKEETNLASGQELSDLDKEMAALSLAESAAFPRSVSIAAGDAQLWREFLDFKKNREQWDSQRNVQWKTYHPSHIQELFANWPVLDTPRLHIRLLDENDVTNSFHILSNVVAMKYYGSPPHENPEYTRKNHINLLLSRFKYRDAVPLAVALKPSGKFIGHVNVVSFDRDFHFADLAYILDPEYWGCGFGTEAVGRVLEFLVKEMKLHKIRAAVFKDNVASRRVLEKVGFEQEGYLRDNVVINGQYEDEYLMAFISKESNED